MDDLPAGAEAGVSAGLTHRLRRLEARRRAARYQELREAVIRMAVSQGVAPAAAEAGVDAALRETDALVARVFGRDGIPAHPSQHDLEWLAEALGVSVDRVMAW